LGDGGDGATCSGLWVSGRERDLSCIHMHVVAFDYEDRERPYQRVLAQLGLHLGHAFVAFLSSQHRTRIRREIACGRRSAAVAVADGDAAAAVAAAVAVAVAAVGMQSGSACFHEGYHRQGQHARLSVTWASCELVPQYKQRPEPESATGAQQPFHVVGKPESSVRASGCMMLELDAGILELL